MLFANAKSMYYAQYTMIEKSRIAILRDWRHSSLLPKPEE